MQNTGDNCVHSEADGDGDGDADGVGDTDSDADSDGDAAVKRCIPCKLHIVVERYAEETTKQPLGPFEHELLGTLRNVHGGGWLLLCLLCLKHLLWHTALMCYFVLPFQLCKRYTPSSMVMHN